VAVEFTFLFAAGNYRTIAIKVYPRAKPMLTAKYNPKPLQSMFDVAYEYGVQHEL